jgi:Kef-type K+ transport system membrane component KefB
MTTILMVGIAVSAGMYVGKLARKVGLPSLIGYMVTGVLMGSSVIGLFSEDILEGLGFVTDIALGFVAFSIGSELNLKALRKLGRSISYILVFETLVTFILVTTAILLLTGDWPFALIFGAMAPATAPAGTVAVIQEYRAKGNLTQALYAVVGFDDGIAVLIFGFAAAASEGFIAAETGEATHILATAVEPLLEILASLATGLLLGYVYTKLVSRLKSHDEIPALTFGFVCVSVGIALTLGFSPILTPMAVGFALTNLSRRDTGTVAGRLRSLMPLVFILFFFIAGTHLRLGALHQLGLLGLTYLLARSIGKITGARTGAVLGRASPVLRKYLGIGLLSQAGVAIGLAIATKSHFARLGEHGAEIGTAVLTTVTATSVIFEIIGPIMAKVALRRAGEISGEET